MKCLTKSISFPALGFLLRGSPSGGLLFRESLNMSLSRPQLVFLRVCLKDFLCAFKLVFRKNVSQNFVGAWNRCARVFVRKILHSFASLVVVWCWTGSFVVLSLVGGILASPRWKRTQPVPFAVVRCVLHRRLCLVLWHQFLFVCPPWSWCCGIEGQRGLEMPWDWRSWCDWNTNIQTDKCTNV